MAELLSGLPPELGLAFGSIIRLEAVDPLTGAAVTGVTISQAVLTARNVADAGGDPGLGPFQLVPGPEAD